MAIYDSTSKVGGAFGAYHRHQVIIGNTRIPLFFRFTQNPNSLEFTFEKEYQETKTIGGYVFEMWGRKPVKIRGKVRIKKDSSLTQVLGINTKTTNFNLEDSTYNPELMILQTLFNIDQRKLAYKMAVVDAVKNISSAATSVYNWIFGGSKEKSTVAEISDAAKKLSKGKINELTERLKSTATSSADAIFTSVKLNNKDISVLSDAPALYDTPSQTSMEGMLSNITDTIIYYKGNLYCGFFTNMTYTEDAEKPFYNAVQFDFLCTWMFTDWIDTQLTQTALGKTLLGVWGAGTTAVTAGSLLKDLVKNIGSVFGIKL